MATKTPAKPKKAAKKTTKKTPASPVPIPTTKTDYAIIVDESSSMSPYTTEVRDFLKRIKSQIPGDSTLNLTFFNNYVNACVTGNAQATTIPAYRPSGGTALRDGVLAGANAIRSGSEPKLIVVITDGEENSSATPKSRYESTMQKDIATDRWTYVFLVPPGGTAATVASGALKGNVIEWTNAAEAFKLVETGLQAFQVARAKGETSVKSYFTTDLSAVTKKEVRELPFLKNVHELQVEAGGDQEIRSFVQNNGLTFTKGCAYYMLTKAETVQAYKEILLKEKTGKTLTVRGPDGARELLGLPNANVRVHPGNHGQFDIYVQSTSVNRKLVPGTKLLVRQ